MNKASAQLALIFSCIGHAFVHLFMALYFIVVLAIEIDWSIPYHDLIGLWTVGSILVGVCAIPAGWLADRWSAPGMMVIYHIGLGGAAIACSFMDAPMALAVGLGAIGLFAAIYHPVGIAWLVRNAESRGKALGINGVFGGLGVAGAGLIAGFLIDVHSWRAAFFVPGVACVATGLALWYCVHRGLVADDGEDRVKSEPVERGAMIRVFIILLMTMILTGLLYQSTQVSLPKIFDLRLRDLAGEGVFGIGFAVAAVYTISSIMQVYGGHLADRYPLKPIYVGAFLLQVPLLIAVGTMSGLPLIVVAMLAVLVNVAALPAENMLLARYAPQKHRSLAFGIKFVLAFTIAPVALQLVAVVQERTGEFVWLYYILGGAALVACFAALMLPKDRGAVSEEIVVSVPAE